MKKNYLLGIRIDNIFEKGIDFHLEKFFNSEKFNMITPVNPEMLIIARKNLKFKNILNKSELNTCDAAGISLAFKLKFKHIEKYPGSSMIFDILNFAEKNNKKVFFLGTKPELNKKARENVKKKYPELRIEGYSPPPYINYPGHKFPQKEEDKIFQELKESKPDILCVFWGAPFQETWFSDNREKLTKLGIKIGISLGGTGDFLSGCIKRAPSIYRKLNLEWLYRLTTEQKRFKRFLTRIPFFVILAIEEAIFK